MTDVLGSIEYVSATLVRIRHPTVEDVVVQVGREGVIEALGHLHRAWARAGGIDDLARCDEAFGFRRSRAP